MNIIGINPPQTWAGMVAKMQAATYNKTTWSELQAWGGWKEQWAGEITCDGMRLANTRAVRLE